MYIRWSEPSKCCSNHFIAELLAYTRIIIINSTEPNVDPNVSMTIDFYRCETQFKSTKRARELICHVCYSTLYPSISSAFIQFSFSLVRAVKHTHVDLYPKAGRTERSEQGRERLKNRRFMVASAAIFFFLHEFKMFSQITQIIAAPQDRQSVRSRKMSAG